MTITPFAAELIATFAKRVALRTGMDLEDASQELTLVILQHSNSEESHLRNVVRQRATKMIRDHRRDKPLSLDEMIQTRGDDDIDELAVQDNNHKARVDLLADMAACLAQLSPKDRAILERLLDSSVRSVSRQTGEHRRTLRRTRAKLREFFIRRGLQNYFE